MLLERPQVVVRGTIISCNLFYKNKRGKTQKSKLHFLTKSENPSKTSSLTKHKNLLWQWSTKPHALSLKLKNWKFYILEKQLGGTVKNILLSKILVSLFNSVEYERSYEL